MRDKVGAYVTLVFFAAIMAAGAFVYVSEAPSPTMVQASLVLCTLALVAELMGVMLSRSISGSVAFIAYLAAIVVAPSWISLVGVSVVRLLFNRRESLKAYVFNLSLTVFTFATTAVFYLAIGGVALSSLGSIGFLAASQKIGLQALLAVALSVAINSVLMSGIVALSSGKRIRVVWRENFLTTIGIDVLAAPVVFVFAWVYVTFGPIGAAIVWVPILGLRQIHKANLDLERTNRELLELMVKSIEARDPYTSGHSRRVHLYSLAIARSLGLPEKTIERVGRAALLHDVGKIHEKYAPILQNPNRLSPDEWLVMKEHPVDGANLVSTVSGLRDVVSAIRGHHENWDGTGYPDSLVGNAIPLDSRIIMFADTIDAMTSERPYRPGLSEEQVRTEIIRARGTQFDPQLADRILSPRVWGVIFPSRAGTRTPAGQLTLVSSKVGQSASS